MELEQFIHKNFICEIVVWNWNNSYMKFSYVKSLVELEQFIYENFICEIVVWNWNNSYMKFSHRKFHI